MEDPLNTLRRAFHRAMERGDHLDAGAILCELGDDPAHAERTIAALLDPCCPFACTVDLDVCMTRDRGEV